MKLIATTALVTVMATGALAGNAHHNVNTGKLPSACSFTNMQPGVMSYDDASESFTSVSAASIDVKQKRNIGVSVVLDRSIDGIDNVVSTLTWGGGATLDGSAMDEKEFSAEATFLKTASQNTIEIDPASVEIDTDLFTPKSNTTYAINWQVTCFE